MILATESAHGGKVPRIVHVAFRNRTWQCAPEQVRPASVDAILARRTLQEAQGLSPSPVGNLHYRRDIRHEVRSLPAAVEPASDDEEHHHEPEAPGDAMNLEAIPIEAEPPDEDELIRELFENDELLDPTPLRDPGRDRTRSAPRTRDVPPAVTEAIESTVRANNVLDGVPSLGARGRSRSPPRDAPRAQEREEAYHVRHEFFEKEPLPFDKEVIEIALLADWAELREGGRAIETVFESCLVASVAKKRRLEINFRHLKPAEKIGMRAAKRKEFAQWLSSKVLNVATAHGVPLGRVVRCRWVLTFKNVETNPKASINEAKNKNIPDKDIREEYSDLGDGRMCKARLVVLGDPDIGEYATYAPTVRRDAKAMVFMIAAHRGWPLRSLDAKAAFLNGRASARPRPIYLLLPKDCEDYLKRVYGTESGPRELYKAAYGLGEAPLAWFHTLCENMRKAGFVQLKSDPCMFVLRGVPPGHRPLPRHYPSDYESLPLLAVIVVHVDDLLLAGLGPEFEHCIAKLLKALPFGSGKQGHFLYVGEMIEQDPTSGVVTVHQREHIRKVTEVDLRHTAPKAELTPAQITEGKGRVGSLLYTATCTRPDLSFEVSHIGSRMNPGATKQVMLDCNKAVRRAKATEERGLTFRRVAENWADVIICVFSDAGWSTRPSLHSQAGGLIFLANRRLLLGEVSLSGLVDWVSSKITWMTSSAHDAEAHACRMNVQTAEHLQFFMYELRSHSGSRVEQFLAVPVSARCPMAVVIDSKGLYTEIDLNKMEKRKTIYVMLLFELLSRTGATLYWVNSGHELADPLTKLPDDAKDTIEALVFALKTGQIRIAYDTESYRKSLQKEKTEVRKMTYENLNLGKSDSTAFDVSDRPSLATGDVECCCD